jgi:hypothetical protein
MQFTIYRHIPVVGVHCIMRLLVVCSFVEYTEYFTLVVNLLEDGLGNFVSTILFDFTIIKKYFVKACVQQRVNVCGSYQFSILVKFLLYYLRWISFILPWQESSSRYQLIISIQIICISFCCHDPLFHHIVLIRLKLWGVIINHG